MGLFLVDAQESRAVNASIGGPAGPFGFVVAVVLAVILIAAWVILAGSRFVQGGVVERAERVPQLYGYTACLIGLIWALTSATTLVDQLLSRGEPALSSSPEWSYGEPSVSSFEAFRATYDRAQRFGSGDPSAAPRDTIPEAELRRRYEALRADRIAQVQFRTRNGIVTSVLGLVLGSALFLFHWRWLRRRGVDLHAPRESAVG
jgi:hypothetical protein